MVITLHMELALYTLAVKWVRLTDASSPAAGFRSDSARDPIRRKSENRRQSKPSIRRSGAASWCDPFARNRSDPRDGRQRSLVSLVSNGHQTTSDFDNCVSTSVRCTTQLTPKSPKHQLRPPPVPGRERHPVACEWSSIVRMRVPTAYSRTKRR